MFPAESQFYATEILEAIVEFTQVFRFDYDYLFSPNLNITVLYLPVGLLRVTRQNLSEVDELSGYSSNWLKFSLFESWTLSPAFWFFAGWHDQV